MEQNLKYKQIEEMAKDIYEQKSCDTSFEENCKLLAYDLVTLGYQKIDENNMIIRKKEFDSHLIEQYELGKEIARKETAREILDEFKKWAREYYSKDTVIDENGERLMTSNEKLNYLYTYLVDKFSVEIKE